MSGCDSATLWSTCYRSWRTGAKLLALAGKLLLPIPEALLYNGTNGRVWPVIAGPLLNQLIGDQIINMLMGVPTH